MDVSKLSDQEKSVLLARAVGKPLSSSLFHNLYNPTNMALAWRCLRWVSQGYEDWRAEFQEWFASTAFELMGEEHAQRIWLDRIFALAIDAGLISPGGDLHG